MYNARWLTTLLTLKHNFDFSNPKILDKEHNLEKRLIVENDRNFKQQKFD